MFLGKCFKKETNTGNLHSVHCRFQVVSSYLNGIENRPLSYQGISRIGEIVDLAVNLGIIDKAGAWFTVEDARIQGRDGVKQHLLDHPDCAERIEARIRANPAALTAPRSTAV